MNKQLAMLLGALCALSSGARAAEVPAPGDRDPRVRYVLYKKDDVTEIRVRRGAVTRIVLEEGEKIEVAGTGFPADCKKDEHEWCVRADVGSNLVWVKPKDNATHNNLELRTNKRDYSMEFKVLADGEPPKGKKALASETLVGEPFFRVIYTYPVQLPSAATMALLAAGNQAAQEKELLERRLKQAPAVRNDKYSKQVLEGGQDIEPEMVFDDGRFTYFQFPANREIPTIYYISPSGEEGRVNFHMEQPDLVAVERLSRRFVLRLGNAVVGIWNDAFDGKGVPAKDGMTVDGVVRVIR